MTEAKGMAPKEWEGRNTLASVRHRGAPSLSVHRVGGKVPGSSSGCAIRAGSLATANSDGNTLTLSGLVTASPNDGPLDHPGGAASWKAGDPVVPTNVRRPGQALSDGETPAGAPNRRALQCQPMLDRASGAIVEDAFRANSPRRPSTVLPAAGGGDRVDLQPRTGRGIS
jgi:hypothetical protein